MKTKLILKQKHADLYFRGMKDDQEIYTYNKCEAFKFTAGNALNDICSMLKKDCIIIDLD